ncbi:hypothetical protein N9X13_03215 [Alphaproteobacteria bacterium]|nr:hypothetical protein [Alphaproteobacteria bacterium]MDA8725510.1 hypothetical protein [Alphaproteobacteria bacterium]MDB2462175.1 hypothetical protein [Alphaproteobacteria bacterium]MDB2487967.1 hypothetical protein [Alphaproteobacteria bacterium]MDC0473856.1 hypothetical protein [Alphaproteobacteria bacterium]
MGNLFSRKNDGDIDYDKAFSGLVVFRASLLTEGNGRAGIRLPGLDKRLREWCNYSRSRRDFVLLIMSAKINNAEETEASIRQKIDISRNTLKAIVEEAIPLEIAARHDNRVISVAAEFYDTYMESYLREWEMMDPDSAKALSVALKALTKKYITMSVGDATSKALEFTVLSRAESVKANRKIRLSNSGEGDGLNLSSWAVVNSFNRDLLLLLMSAAITGNHLSVAEIMKRLHVSRNAVKTSLRLGIDGGFITRSNGYSCSGKALKDYLNWHYAVFSSYSDDLLSASALFYEYLATREID